MVLTLIINEYRHNCRKESVREFYNFYKHAVNEKDCNRKIDVEFDGSVVRPGRFFVRRLTLMVGLNERPENGDTQLAAVPMATGIPFDQQFNADLEW